jgi:hypothetical protein
LGEDGRFLPCGANVGNNRGRIESLIVGDEDLDRHFIAEIHVFGV